MGSNTAASWLPLLSALVSDCSSVAGSAVTAEQMRKIEESRLRVLVSGDADEARETLASRRVAERSLRRDVHGDAAWQDNDWFGWRIQPVNAAH